MPVSTVPAILHLHSTLSQLGGGEISKPCEQGAAARNSGSGPDPDPDAKGTTLDK